MNTKPVLASDAVDGQWIRWCIADVSMLEDGFERLLAGKDDVKVLVKVRR